MNPCVRTKILCVDESELERAEDIGIQPEYYWSNFSFKIYNIETYEEVNREGIRCTLLNLLDGSQFTLKMKFEELVALEDAYYSNQSNQVLWRIAN